MQLDENKLNIISDKLLDFGLTFEPLKEDLLDHIACMIEIEMDKGIAFQIALENSLHILGAIEVQEIEENTIYLLTNKNNQMKKIIGIIGIITSILIVLAVLFKRFHLQGASVLLVIGMVVISVVLFPLMAKIDLQSMKTKLQKGALLAGYASAMILSISVLLKIMKWPFANVLLTIGFVLLIFVFMPLFTYKNFKLTENKIFALSKSFLIIAGVILFWGLAK